MDEFGGGRLILRVVAGSRAHGLATEHSDLDTRGVCIPSVARLLGLSPFEQWESERGDHVVFALAKFVRLALAGNPNIIETLFTDETDILFVDADYGRPLLQRREEFLSRKVGERFMRYALDQLGRMQRHHRWLAQPPPRKPEPQDFGATLVRGRHRFPNADLEKAYRDELRHWREYDRWMRLRNPARAELERRFGYDTKHAMHLCRLLRMGREVLELGLVNVRRPDREWLLGVRNGAFSYDDLIGWATEQTSALPALMARSSLPDEPNSRAIEAIVIELQARCVRAHA